MKRMFIDQGCERPLQNIAEFVERGKKYSSVFKVGGGMAVSPTESFWGFQNSYGCFHYMTERNFKFELHLQFDYHFKLERRRRKRFFFCGLIKNCNPKALTTMQLTFA